MKIIEYIGDNMEYAVLTVLILLTINMLLFYRRRVLNELENSKQVELRSVGIYESHGTKYKYNLSCYYVDRDNHLYSRNPETWELNPRRGHDILRCSDRSFDRSGRIVNSMRTPLGRKVTVGRNRIDFDSLTTPVETFVLKETVKNRKYKIVGILN